MWTNISSYDTDSSAPSSRSKHSATLVGEHVYVLGGRNGNLPLKDFWKYNLVTGKWQQLKPGGDKLPALQEHTAVVYKDFIYVFGGEVGFSAGTETPLWTYDIKNNTWKKIRSKKGVSTPKGRRGHTALVHRGSMLIYGGYQDLKGSCSELWAYHFETESWHLLSTSPKGSSEGYPPPRHKHSAVLHNDCIWVYGGMTDLQERGDLWRWDIASGSWTTVRTKVNPGNLHSHAACKLPCSMVLFGGEKDGHPTNDLWKFNFSIETWERITVTGIKPQPRSESVAFTVSDLLLRDTSTSSLESKTSRIRARTCNSAERGNRHSSYFSGNRVAPCEKTYVFMPSNDNYTDGSNDLALQYSENRGSRSILQEITKLSQMNISRLNAKCSYSVLVGCPTDSTESLLKQHATPPGAEIEGEDVLIATPTRGTMVKSKSAYVIKKKYNSENDTNNKRKVEFDSTVKKIPHEPISVPNFSILNLPTPVLTPVEAARLVYLDTDDENDLLGPDNQTQTNEKENFSTVKRGESYSSHLAYADNPLYQSQMEAKLPHHHSSQENISSTSDYASIETVNRLSSSSNYSVKTQAHEKKRQEDGAFGFCNPNYMGPDIKSLLNGDKKKHVAKMLNHSESLIEETNNLKNSEENLVEMRNIGRNTINLKNSEENLVELRNIGRNSKVFYKNQRQNSKFRASSASRVERNRRVEERRIEQEMVVNVEPFVPIYVYVVGGREQGQVTVFQRPLSIWRLKVF